MKWKRVRKFGWPTQIWYLQNGSEYAVIERYNKEKWLYGVFSGLFQEGGPYLFVFSHTHSAPNKAYAKFRATMLLMRSRT